jgi:hypothetical protein
MLLHQVAPTRVIEFENLIAYVREALAKSNNPRIREQAKGWKFYRVGEVGPNGDVLFAFLFDPAVPCVDYALGPILAEAFPDPAQLGEIWKLYTGSVRSGGTLMNLVPVAVKPAPPILTAPATPGGAAAPAGGTQKPPVTGQKP